METAGPSLLQAAYSANRQRLQQLAGTDVMLSLWTWARDHVLMLPNTVTVLLSPLMTWNYLKYVTVSKSLPPQLSSARFCHDWDLLCTLLCTLWTGSRCTIVQNSRAFYVRLKIVLSTLLSSVHCPPTRHKHSKQTIKSREWRLFNCFYQHHSWTLALFPFFKSWQLHYPSSSSDKWTQNAQKNSGHFPRKMLSFMNSLWECMFWPLNLQVFEYLVP